MRRNRTEREIREFRTRHGVLAPYTVWATLFILVPLAFVAYYAFTDNDFNFTFDNITRFFTATSQVINADGSTEDIAADSVILSVGYTPAPVAKKSGKVHIVGDADKVGNLRSVIWQAWDVAMKL